MTQEDIDELNKMSGDQAVTTKQNASAPATSQDIGSQPQKVNVPHVKFQMELTHVKNYVLNHKDKKKLDPLLNKHKDMAEQRILELANIGLSIANKDYYIVPYGGELQFQIDYKGLIKACSLEASKNGYQLMAKADTIRKGFTDFSVSTSTMIDELTLTNTELKNEIVTAYAIVSLYDKQTREKVFQKVEVMPLKEFENAKNASKGGTVHKDYATEMSKKIPLRRVIKILNSMFPSDALDKLLNFDNESYNIDPNYIDQQQQSTDELLGLTNK